VDFWVGELFENPFTRWFGIVLVDDELEGRFR
jgi:hypothetical protein